MTTRRQRLETELTLKDNATEGLRDAEESADRLDDRTIAAKLQVELREAKADLRAFERDLRDVDGKDAEAKVLANIDDAKDDIDYIESQLRQLDGETVDVDVKSDGVKDLIGDLDVAGVSLGNLASGPAGAAALGTAMFAAVEHTAELRTEVAELAKLVGSSTEEASKLASVWRASDADVKDLQDVMLQLNGVLADSPELAEQLGINLDDGKSAVDRFVEVTEKLNTEIGDATERGVLGSKLFGEEGVRQVNRVVLMAGDLRTAMEEIPAAEIVTEEQARQALEYEQAIADLKQSFTALVGTIADELVPALATAAEGADLLIEGADKDLLFGVSAKDIADFSVELVTLQGPIKEIGKLFKNDTKPSVDGLVSAIGDVVGSLDEQNYWADRVKGTMGLYNTKVDEAARKSDTLEYWTNRVGQAFEDAEGDVDEFTGALDELTSRYNTENALNNLQNAGLRVAEQFEAAKLAAEEGGTAAVIAANDAETSWNDLKLELIDVITQMGLIPDEARTRIIAEIDQFSIDQVNAYIANLQRGVNIPIRPYVAPTSSNPDAGFGGGGNYVPPGGGGPVASRPTTVTYNIDARGSSPAQVAAEIERRRRLDQ